MPSVFDPLVLRSVTLKNRFVVSPMCMYSSMDGHASDFHLVHLGSRAMGGYALIFAEATAVSPEGRITPDDAGLYLDSHIEPLSRITRFIKNMGSVPAIQLAHAGRKASTTRPFSHPNPHAPLLPADGGWQTMAPSPIPFDKGYGIPHELTIAEIHKVTQDFIAAARRAIAAGYQILEIHAAHGYLLNSFLSPITNKRTDHYGGSFENRTRFLMETVAALRKLMPDAMPLFVRLSATDWLDDQGGWTVHDSVALAKLLKAAGVDLVDCSSGNISPDSRPPFASGFQVPLAAAVKREAQIPTGAVGMIDTPQLAAHIIESEQADLIFNARQALRDPYFPHTASRVLDNRHAIPLPPQYARS